MNNKYLEEQQLSPEEELTFHDQKFYSPRMVLDRSKYPEGVKIPVISIVNHDILKDGENIAQHNSRKELKDSVQSMDQFQPPIDQWVPAPEDKLFSHIQGTIIVPIHKLYNIPDTDKATIQMLDYFCMTPKRCYNSGSKIKDGVTVIGFRDHCTNYINYFEKYYDKDHILLSIYARIKYMIDCVKNYKLDNFLHDLWKEFINPNASYTAQQLNYYLDKMNIEQYNLELNYHNNKSPVLEYSDFHAKIMLKISVMQNMIIPLVSHFLAKNRVPNDKIRSVLLKTFDLLFQAAKMIYNVDLVSKIYETTYSNIIKNVTNNSVLWEMQTIRGRNSTTHSMETIENIIMQIIPKYTYSKNIIHFNYNAINRDIKYKVTDIPYEYGFVMLSSSNRDEDNNSECDKFEAHAAKINEAILVQTLVNCKSTMQRIEMKYGPFDENEIKFYYKELCKDGKFIVNSLQKTLVTYLFAKDFDDPQSAKIINIRQYIILIIAARRLLESYHLFQLPYMIGGKVLRVATRKNINKKELQKIESSKYYPMIHQKYNNYKIEHDIILILMAQILSSEFQTIDYRNPDLNGRKISVIPDVVSEEICRFIMLI